MVRSSSRKRLFALSLLAIGAIVVGLGAGAAYAVQHFAADPPAAKAAAAQEERSDGMIVELGLDASVAGVDVSRDVHLDPEQAKALPAPGLSVHREVGEELPVDVPVEADLDLDVASGSHVRRGTGSVETASVAAPAGIELPSAGEAAVLAAAAFAGAGLVAYFWASIKTVGYKLFVAPVLGLYAHITRAEVFDNDVREKIFQAIRLAPGVSASELSRSTGVSWGTTMYHLDVLEQTRMVASQRDGRYRRYFINGADISTSKEVVGLLRNAVTSGVVETVRARPGATQKELAGLTNLTPQALHWHLARLVGAGIVRKERDGRLVRHYAEAAGAK